VTDRSDGSFDELVYRARKEATQRLVDRCKGLNARTIPVEVRREAEEHPELHWSATDIEATTRILVAGTGRDILRAPRMLREVLKEAKRSFRASGAQSSPRWLRSPRNVDEGPGDLELDMSVLLYDDSVAVLARIQSQAPRDYGPDGMTLVANRASFPVWLRRNAPSSGSRLVVVHVGKDRVGELQGLGLSQVMEVIRSLEQTGRVLVVRLIIG
jgi:hypothetical protein